ncbi:hypothetical protein DSUL_160055 [Desulfovibrionales bacterium]
MQARLTLSNLKQKTPFYSQLSNNDRQHSINFIKKDFRKESFIFL